MKAEMHYKDPSIEKESGSYSKDFIKGAYKEE